MSNEWNRERKSYESVPKMKPHLAHAWIGAIVCGILFLPATIVGQTTVTKRANPQALQTGRQLPFDDLLETLPTHFPGNEADTIYDLINTKWANPTKSEFETEAAYEARWEEFASKPFSGSTTASAQFGFVLGRQLSEPLPSGWPQELSGRIESSYAAEENELTVKIPIDLAALDTETTDKLAFTWTTSYSIIGTFIGSNALGVHKTIYRAVMRPVDLELRDSDWLNTQCNSDYAELSCSFKLDTESARSFSRNPRAIVVGSIVWPFITAEHHTTDATISDPEEVHEYRRIIYLKIEQLWFFDPQTGRVFLRLSRERTKSDSHPQFQHLRNDLVHPAQATPPTRANASAQPQKAEISGAVAEGMLLEKTVPVYPPIAKAALVSGTVVLQATISKTGTVENLRVISGPAMLQESAMEAVKSWRYRPYLLNNEPVEVETTVQVVFTFSR